MKDILRKSLEISFGFNKVFLNPPKVSTFTKVVEDIELKGKSWSKLKKW